MTTRVYGTLEERFWPKVDKDGPIPEHDPGLGPCWVWTASTDGHGYGQINAGRGDKVPAKAHRVSWALEHGPITGDVCVLHRCDNPPCVNPGHLYAGDRRQNALDAMERGQWVRPPVPDNRGERCGTSKLTEGDVHEIRVRYAAGGITQRELAEDYPVNQRHISRIIRGDRWAWL